MRTNRTNIFILVIILFAVFASAYFSLISELPAKGDVHFNLLTTSTVFSGFLFTSLGLLIGFVDKAHMPELEEAGFTGQYFNGVLFGISIFLISISISLILIINPDISIALILYNIEVFLMIGGIIYFVKAVYDVFSILKQIRKYVRKEYRKSRRY